MKGQRIHNAGATSQHPPIAPWCESSALKLVKCESEGVRLTERGKSELCLWHLQRYTPEYPLPPATREYERSRVRFYGLRGARTAHLSEHSMDQ